jgi:hypothetical protein
MHEESQKNKTSNLTTRKNKMNRNQKELARIAFDAFQCFADSDRKYPSWDELSHSDKMVFERIAGRVSAEISFRLQDLLAQLLPTVV